MRVRDVMTTDVVTADPHTPFQELVDLMVKHDISGIPVVEDGRLVGIVTEADLVSKEAFGGHHRRPLELIADFVAGGETRWAAKSRGVTAGQVMSRQLVTAHAADELPVAARRMLEAGVKRLLVVDGEEHLIGVITRTDLLCLLHRSDADVREDLVTLFSDPLRAPERGEIHVSVISGEVTLTGTVEFPHDLPFVSALAWSVPGVVDVDNLTTARNPEPRLAST